MPLDLFDIDGGCTFGTPPLAAVADAPSPLPQHSDCAVAPLPVQVALVLAPTPRHKSTQARDAIDAAVAVDRALIDALWADYRGDLMDVLPAPLDHTQYARRQWWTRLPPTPRFDDLRCRVRAADDADTVQLTLAALVFVNAQHPACSVQLTSRAGRRAPMVHMTGRCPRCNARISATLSNPTSRWVQSPCSLLL